MGGESRGENFASKLTLQMKFLRKKPVEGGLSDYYLWMSFYMLRRNTDTFAQEAAVY